MIRLLKQRKWKKVIEQSNLFDKTYYLFNYPDVRLGDIDPIEHYIQVGAKEGRNPSADFDTTYYLNHYSDIDIEVINPLYHYICFGCDEGRIAKTSNLILAEQSVDASNDILNQLIEKNSTAIAVVVHIFYPELLDEIIEYLKNIDQDYTLIATFPKAKAEVISSLLDTSLPDVIKIEVENSGYDILPFLEVLPLLKKANYRYFCKLHTKRNHSNKLIGSTWRESLLDGVLASPKLVDEILEAFENDNELYMVGSKINYLSYQASKYENDQYTKSLTKTLDIAWKSSEDFGFIAGSIFWGRVESFIPFGEKLPHTLMQSNAFSGQTSSWFHAIERLFGILSTQGKKIALVEYSLSTYQSMPFLEYFQLSKPSLLTATLRYPIYRYKERYLSYRLLIQSGLLDALWCYETYPQLAQETLEDCIWAFLDDRIEFLSLKHCEEVKEIQFKSDKLFIEYYNGKSNAVELKSYHLCEAIMPYTEYEVVDRVEDEEIMVSIICATYNHEKYIQQALESIVSQKTNFKFEILVGDDASSDATVDVIEKIHKAYPNIIIPILHQSNVGAKQNHAQLFAKARGKYITINEGDDYWIDDRKLQMQVDYMQAHQECSVSFHAVKVIDEDDESDIKLFPPNLEGHRFSIDRLMQRNVIQTNSVMYRYNLLKRWSVHPLLMPGDWYRHFINALYGEIHFIPKVMSCYRKHEGGIWSGLKIFNRQYNIGQIVFAQELNKITENQFHVELYTKAFKKFEKLYWYYFEKQKLDKLFELITTLKDISNLFFKNNNIAIDPFALNTQEELLARYKKIYLINVVVTSYNHATYIAQALESIMAQEGFYALRLVIADDASSDNTLEIIKNTLKNVSDKEVFIFEKGQNLGMLKNMQRSFEECNGEFSAICEGDDYWIDISKLHKQLTFMLQNPQASMCFNWLVLNYLGENRSIPHPIQSNINEKFVSFETILRTALTANFSCCFYKTSVIKQIPTTYFEQKQGADWLFNLYMATLGKVGFIKDLMSVYRVHDGGQWSGLSPQEQYLQRQYSYQRFMKFFPKYQDVIFPLIEVNQDQERVTIKSTQLREDNNIQAHIDQIKPLFDGIDVRGWLVDKRFDSIRIEHKYLIVLDEQCQILEKHPLKNILREDLVVFFRDDTHKFEWGGFSGMFTFNHLEKGRYKIAFGLLRQEVIEYELFPLYEILIDEDSTLKVVKQ